MQLRCHILSKPNDRLKDLLFLDIALDSTVRTTIEKSYEELNSAKPEKVMYLITLVLENLTLSSDNNEDLIYCLKGWNQALVMLETGDGSWALFAKSILDRTRLALASKGELYHQILQPSAEYHGARLNLDQWAVSIFTEEMIRAGSAASLSSLVNRLDPILRNVANLGRLSAQLKLLDMLGVLFPYFDKQSDLQLGRGLAAQLVARLSAVLM